MSNFMKKRRLDDDGQNNDDNLVTFDALSTDELERIFEYLSPENIMLARLNKKMKDAATKIVVPMDSDIDNAFYVDNVRKYNVLAAMRSALPNLQQIVIRSLHHSGPIEDKYNDGEDPDVRFVIHFADLVPHDIGILSNFVRLRELKIDGSHLNGRYPFLFNFPLLQKLYIRDMKNFKWDLEMLAGLPNLEELTSQDAIVTGNIRSLRVLKDTLTKFVISLPYNFGDEHIYLQGNLMDLADFPKLQHLSLSFPQLTGDLNEIRRGAFPALEMLTVINDNFRGDFMSLSSLPHLKALHVRYTKMTGDIRDIGSGDFPSLESLHLPPSVYCGCAFKLQSISDAPEVIAVVSTLLKQRPNLYHKDWYAELSDDSPDWYYGMFVDEFDESPQPPLKIEIVKAGSRMGWRWLDFDTRGDTAQSCEINWLDPEPDKGSDHYEQYIQELAWIEDTLDAYRGLYQPPTEEEYERIHSKYEY